MEIILGFFEEIRAFMWLIIPVSALIGLAVWFVANAFKVAFPKWAQAADGFVQTVIWGLLIVGGSPVWVPALFTMMGTGG